MAPSPDHDDGLFTPERSLGSFAAKITLAGRLGLIDATVEKALHAIRSVRNDFAHSAMDPSLEEERHQKRLARAYESAALNPLWAALEPLLQQPHLAAVERSFILLVTILVASVEACAQLQTPFRPRATVRFTPDH